jgi:hypothetical protein
MKLLALTLPDDPAEQPRWLEQRLVSLQLRRFVREWEKILGGSTPPRRSLNDLLGSQREGVLNQGLSVLSADQLHALLDQPRLLFDLQELVLVEGGPYWESVATSDDLEAQAAEDRNWLLSQLPSFPAETAPRDPLDLEIDAPAPAIARPPVGNHAIRRTRRRGLMLGALAAMVTAAATIWLVQSRSQPWGFEQPGRFETATTAEAYFQQLVVAASDWDRTPAATAAQLRDKLIRFTRGCRQLASAPHAVLPPQKKAWLVKSCIEWSDKLDQNLASLDANTVPFEQVRDSADATVRELIGELQKRAAPTA